MELRAEGIHHVTLVSADAARTLAFYRDVLGLRLVKKTVGLEQPSMYHLYLGDAAGTPGTVLAFLERPGARRGHWGVGGVHHVALGVASEDAQLRWKRRLTDAGVRVGGPYDRHWFRSIYFTDPDGQILEIATRGPGYTVDEPAHALGQREVLPPEGNLRGHRDEAAIAARTWPEPVPEITPDMELEGIHHITGLTDDLERAHVFMEEGLGLRRVKQTVNQDDARTRHHFWAAYDGRAVAPRSSITLFDWAGSTLRARDGAGQAHQYALRATDAEQLAHWREHLLTLGLEVSGIVDRTYFRSISFRAPDGQRIEIATDGPGFFVDEEPGRLGTDLKLPAGLEGERERIAAALVPLG